MSNVQPADEIAELRRRNHELAERLLELSTLYHVSRALSLSLLTENLLDITGAIYADVFHADAFVLYLDDPHRRRLYPVAIHQREHGGRLPDAVGYDHPVIGAALGQRGARTWSATELRSVWADAPASFAGSTWVGPIRPPDGSPSGVMCVVTGGLGSPERDALFERVAEHVAVAIENARFIGEARAQSIQDPLTELYNRRYLDDRLEREVHRAARYKRVFSLAALDVDRFKGINDCHGHEVGDRVLKRMGEVLRNTVRQSDVVVRYGGDEFVVLLPETDKHEAATALSHILDRVREQPPLDGEGSPFPYLSAGLATFPHDATTSVDLFRKADRALYRAKGQGGNRIVLADPRTE